jgi:phosphoribosylglycinamide formyltransferase 1
MTNNKLPIGIMISGRGSNMAAILKATQEQDFPAKVVVVISNKKDAKGLETAKSFNVPTFVIDSKQFNSKSEYEQEIVKVLQSHDIQLLALAGYMKIVGKDILSAYNNRILNIHPSLLPSFKGLHAQEQAINAGVKYSGCSVHFVDDSLDGGPIILQEVVKVEDNDTEETLSEKILKYEHQLYSKAIKLYAEDKLEIINNKVKIKNL